jgi:hypothetical protein
MAAKDAPLPAPADAGKLLVVGLNHAKASSSLAGPVPYTTMADLDRSVLASVTPDLVLCALVAADLAAGDAFALVEKLEQLGYPGRILVLCPNLPRPAMIEAELRALGPGPRLTLIARDRAP